MSNVRGRIGIVLYGPDAVVRRRLPVVVERMVLPALLAATPGQTRHVLITNLPVRVRQIVPGFQIVVFR